MAPTSPEAFPVDRGPMRRPLALLLPLLALSLSAGAAAAPQAVPGTRAEPAAALGPAGIDDPVALRPSAVAPTLAASPGAERDRRAPARGPVSRRERLEPHDASPAPGARPATAARPDASAARDALRRAGVAAWHTTAPPPSSV